MAMKITQQKHTSIRSIHLCQIPKHITVHQATLPRHPSLVDGTAFRRSNDLAAQAGGTHWNDGNTLKITRQAWLETWFHGLKKYLWKKHLATSPPILWCWTKPTHTTWESEKDYGTPLPQSHEFEGGNPNLRHNSIFSIDWGCDFSILFLVSRSFIPQFHFSKAGWKVWEKGVK